MRNVISPVAQVLLTLNLTVWWRMTKGYHSKTTSPLVKSSFHSYISLYPSNVPFILHNVPFILHKITLVDKRIEVVIISI